jgi:murein DD-endopeptidase MepM/ murein hydrolase activator NlpD
VGAVAAAQRELELALCGDPRQEMAQELMRQIQTPADRLFGSESFPYVVQPGDSLSRIADEFLGDAFLFYALARYNRLGNPSQLKAGQTVRIPVTEHSRTRAERGDVTPPAVTADPPGGAFTRPVSVSLQATDDTDPRPAIHFTLDGAPPTAESPRYTAPIPLERTTTLMSVAIDAGGNTSRVRTDRYALTESRAEADASYSSGMAALARGEREAAYQALRRALELAPSHAAARREIEPLRAALVQHYRKEATDAFRQQDLDGAIAGWDRVLEFDPSNRMATLERARALDLKKKLERFGSQ